MNLVDEQRMAMRPAVELSYLAPEEQKVVYEETMLRDCMPSHAQTIRMSKLSERNMLTDSTIDDIMREEKPNQKEKLHIPYDQIREFLPRNTTYKQKCEYIRQALEFYKKHAS